MENTTKEANIIGNGFFDTSTINKELPCVTCNFMHMELNPIATVSFDLKVLSKIDYTKLSCKAVIRKGPYIFHKQQDLVKSAEPDQVLFISSTLMNNINSGQFACQYLIQEGFTKLNIYGITSRFKMDLSSESDKYYPKNISNIATRIPRWNAKWDAMIAHYSNIEFNFIPT